MGPIAGLDNMEKRNPFFPDGIRTLDLSDRSLVSIPENIILRLSRFLHSAIVYLFKNTRKY